MLSAWRLLSCVNRPFGEGFSGHFILNVSSHPKQSFKLTVGPYREGRGSATSGRYKPAETVGNFGQSVLVSRKASFVPGVHSSFHVADVRKAHVL